MPADRVTARPVRALIAVAVFTACSQRQPPALDVPVLDSGTPVVPDVTDDLVDAAIAPDVTDVTDVVIAPPDAGPRPLRLIAPLSGSTTTSRRPTLHWSPRTGATTSHLEICSDRACTMVEHAIDATDRAAPPTDLAPGLHYWRVRHDAEWSHVWQFSVGHRSASIDTSWGTTPDYDGDGFADVVIAAPHARTEAGRVYVYRGGTAGLRIAEGMTLESPDASMGHFGWAVATAGDVNGDGFVDLVVAAPDAAMGTGRVYVFAGGPMGLAARPSGTLEAPAPNGNFGMGLASAGDVDGDGYADVIVGAPSLDAMTGGVYVFRGGAMGLSAAPAMIVRAPDGIGGGFGTAIASAGDVNGDGFNDVVIGAHGAADTAGRAHIYLGSTAGLIATPAMSTTGPDGPSSQFGSAVANAGDLNGDGLSDVAIGAPGSVNGSVFVYAGSTTGVQSTATTAIPSEDGMRGGFGWAVASAGDVNHDGFGDLLATSVCAPFGLDPDGGYPTCGSGIARVYAGSAGGASIVSMLTLAGEPLEYGGAFGWSAMSAGDIDRDGYDDLIVGAMAVSAYVGAAYVYRGVAGGFATELMHTLRGTDGSGGNYGWSVALATPRERAPRCVLPGDGARAARRLAHARGT